MARLQNFLLAAILFLAYQIFTRPRCDKRPRPYSMGQNASTSPAPTVQDICAGEKATECVPPFVAFRQQYRVAAKYSLAACSIEKNFSTFLTAIMCFLHNETNFRAKNRTLDREVYHKRLCANVNEFGSLATTNVTFKGNWALFAVIRNPLERFVSGFVDKCLREQTWKTHTDRCNRCKTNLTCFVEAQYKRMMAYAKSKKRVSFDDDHFFPQSWRCEFSTRMNKYRLLKLNVEKPAAFFDELIFLLQRQHVPDAAIEYIDSHLRSQRTKHSTVESKERTAIEEQIAGSAHLTSRLVQMYFFDFVLFGYPLPTIPEPRG